MLENLMSMEDCPVADLDGPVGRVSDFYFCDRSWMVKFVVIHCGEPTGQRQVLLAPSSLSFAFGADSTLYANLSRAQFNALGSAPDTVSAERFPGLSLSARHTGHQGRLLVPSEFAERAQLFSRPSAGLRSAKLVTAYQPSGSAKRRGETVGVLVQLPAWEVRYLAAYWGDDAGMPEGDSSELLRREPATTPLPLEGT